MIERTTAIPLAIYPYSTRSHIVHWLTRHHGLISTLLKAAQHPRSPFLGEYQLFGTTELLYYNRHKEGLYTAKECALLHPRKPYRQNWRAMQTASYALQRQENDLQCVPLLHLTACNCMQEARRRRL